MYQYLKGAFTKQKQHPKINSEVHTRQKIPIYIIQSSAETVFIIYIVDC